VVTCSLESAREAKALGKVATLMFLDWCIVDLCCCVSHSPPGSCCAEELTPFPAASLQPILFGFLYIYIWLRHLQRGCVCCLRHSARSGHAARGGGGRYGAGDLSVFPWTRGGRAPSRSSCCCCADSERPQLAGFRKSPW